jgi:hypothetical protein
VSTSGSEGTFRATRTGQRCKTKLHLRIATVGRTSRFPWKRGGSYCCEDDPAAGDKVYSFAEASKHLTGVALELIPSFE